MKGFMIITVCLCGLLFAVLMSFADNGNVGQTEAVPVFGDQPMETELVASFYRVLLQEEAPTLAQEKALFADSNLRGNLIEAQGQDAEQPLILNLCRQHRDLFLPIKVRGNPLQTINISTPYRFARRVSQRVDDRTFASYVMVFLPIDDQEVSPPTARTIVFEISGGRIQPDEIQLRGHASHDPMDHFFERFAKWPDEMP